MKQVKGARQLRAPAPSLTFRRKRRAVHLLIAGLAVLGATHALRVGIDFGYDVVKIRRAYYNEHRMTVQEWDALRATQLSPDGLRVLDAMATDFLQRHQPPAAPAPK